MSFFESLQKKGIQARDKLIREFNHLSSEQLNWKPSEEKWSIAQCLDHLIVSDRGYFPAFQRIADGTYRMNWWERTSPLSNVWGTLMVKQLGETVKNKSKAPGIFRPSQSLIDDDIVLRYNSNLDRLLELINNCRHADPDNIIITSPVAKFITYSLRDALTFLLQHEHRHLNQGIKVKQATGFPS